MPARSPRNFKHAAPRTRSGLLVFFAVRLLVAPAQAQDGDLEEAAPLPPAQGVDSTPKSGSEGLPGTQQPSSFRDLHFRAESAIGAEISRARGKTSCCAGTLTGETDARASRGRLSGFLGASFALRTDAAGTRAGLHADELGLRLRTADAFVFALGKERNKRAPAAFLNPSDPIHSSERLPGLAKDRAGVWLGRASFQSAKVTLDAIVLPIASLNAQGFPSASAKDSPGAYLRGFSLSPAGEMQLALGWDPRHEAQGKPSGVDALKVGAAWQRELGKRVKGYAEASWDEHAATPFGAVRGARAWVLGLTFDVSSQANLRGEWIHNGTGLDKSSWVRFKRARSAAAADAASPQATALPQAAALSAGNANAFPRREYLLLSAVFPELTPTLSAQASHVQSLEDPGFVQLLRMDLALGERTAAGISLIRFSTAEDAQFFFRPFDFRSALELRASL